MQNQEINQLIEVISLEYNFIGDLNNKGNLEKDKIQKSIQVIEDAQSKLKNLLKIK